MVHDGDGSECEADMAAGIGDVSGISVGHASDARRLTGCTVILCPEGAVVSVDVRGAAPATRETDLCRPGTLVERAHAIYLGGGSAYGLDAAAGVMRFLREHGIGFETGIMPVPIVPGACLFDLGLGEAAWPDEEMAYRACLEARAGPIAEGCVGAGMGATVGKFLGPDNATKSGIGTSAVLVDGVVVAALVAVNAFGSVVDPGTGAVVAGARDTGTGGYVTPEAISSALLTSSRENTTIGVVATDASLTDSLLHHLVTVAHDGLARTIMPAHTLYDGDALFGLATGQATTRPSTIALEVAVVRAVEAAVLRAVLTAEPMGGVPAAFVQT